ncbi:hypothetical protein [Microcystis sp. M061S2]|uniref:hypothetical protein n=1 Tax=Microcystis sp. M061S2 TaxID=2771171 RepID=UPI0025851D5C|nr:hypothetical protein [Microcystis sp. M061S2]
MNNSVFGRLVSVTGGCDPVRHWQRMLALYYPEILEDPKTLRQGLMIPNPLSIGYLSGEALMQQALMEKGE